MKQTEFRRGYVAIAGRPNVGKSTLLNALIKQKLAITSPKPQTTRHKIMGILTEQNYQIVFFDTPGLFTPDYILQSMMVKTALATMHEADVVLLLVDAAEKGYHLDPKIIAEIHNVSKPVLLVMNKIDLVPKEHILPLIDAYREIYPFSELIPISALQKEGLEHLLQVTVSYLPEGIPFYPAEALTDQTERFFVSELIREIIFKKFKDEIPYSATVKIAEFKKRKKLYIRADIFVERDSQKAILIGEGGKALKELGRKARREIEIFLEEDVFLDLWVKVRKKWRRKKHDVKDLEYTP
ncbi:MAG: GTPase Era [Gemmatimonadota bacterium]|nr:MAG: GTPase Era [Gemmatimonadota bacterium]